MAFKWFKAEGNGAFIGKDDDDNVFEIHPSRKPGEPHEGYFTEGPHGSWEGTPAQLKKIAVQVLAEHKVENRVYAKVWEEEASARRHKSRKTWLVAGAAAALAAFGLYQANKV